MAEEEKKQQLEINGEENGYEIAKKSLRRNQKERKLRKKRKKANQLKKVLRFLTFLFVIFLIYKFVLLSGWYMKENVLKKGNSDINIINNNIVKTDIILNDIDNIPIKNLPIFMFDVNIIKQKLYKIPVIKRVYVRRYAFPARSDVMVKERIPTVVLKTNLKKPPVAFYTSDNILITDRNYMDFHIDKSVRVILVKSPFSSKSWTKKKFAYLEKIIREVEQNSEENVQYMDVRKPNDVYRKIPSANIRLGALDSSVFERIKRIYTILPEISDLNGKVRYIDLSWDKVNYIKLK